MKWVQDVFHLRHKIGHYWIITEFVAAIIGAKNSACKMTRSPFVVFSLRVKQIHQTCQA